MAKILCRHKIFSLKLKRISSYYRSTVDGLSAIELERFNRSRAPSPSELSHSTINRSLILERELVMEPRLNSPLQVLQNIDEVILLPLDLATLPSILLKALQREA